jgi:diguanylate cyclase (GGDEF)-like protein
LEHAFLRGRRSRNLTAILFCDLDKFKRVNDVFGHRVGDELLIAVAERLAKQLRPGDTLARLAGDEFILVLEDVSEAEVRVIAGRVDAAFTDPFLLSCGEVRTNVSIGIAFAGRGNERPVKVLEKADLAMYQAKREGGGRHYVLGYGEPAVMAQRGAFRPRLRP